MTEKNEGFPGTIEAFESRIEANEREIGRAITSARRVWPGTDIVRFLWKELATQFGVDDYTHRMVVFIVEQDDTENDFDCQHELRRIWRHVVGVLKSFGIDSVEDLPEADRKLLGQHIEIREYVAISANPSPLQDLMEVEVEGVSDKMLSLLHPDFTPAEIRANAAEHDGVADLFEIDAERKSRADALDPF